MTARIIVADVLAHVAREFGLTLDEMRGSCRRKWLVEARFAAVWLARRHTAANLSGIGRVLGGRNHSTIIFAERRSEQLRERNDCFRRKTDALDAMLREA